jgi:hypothetical protein
MEGVRMNRASKQKTTSGQSRNRQFEQQPPFEKQLFYAIE